MAHQQIPTEAASFEIDLTKAVGLKQWQSPPAYWTGESMKPTLLPALLMPNTVFHNGQTGQKSAYQKMRQWKKEMVTIGGEEPRKTKTS